MARLNAVGVQARGAMQRGGGRVERFAIPQLSCWRLLLFCATTERAVKMILEPYSPAWADEFAALREVYLAALGGLVLRVEHVGSTAVPGLVAKPILDIDLVIESCDVFPKVVVALGQLGYGHAGDQGIREREVFKPVKGMAPLTQPPRQWMAHHLYVCPARSAELTRHVAFRDALRARSDLRDGYALLKSAIAARCNGDRKLYARIKESEGREFVERVLSSEINRAR